MPGVSGVVAAEKAKVVKEIEDFMLKDADTDNPVHEMPEEGLG